MAKSSGELDKEACKLPKTKLGLCSQGGLAFRPIAMPRRPPPEYETSSHSTDRRRSLQRGASS